MIKIAVGLVFATLAIFPAAAFAADVDLLLSLEEEFGISITDDAFGEARTLDQIVALVSGLKGVAA